MIKEQLEQLSAIEADLVKKALAAEYDSRVLTYLAKQEAVDYKSKKELEESQEKLKKALHNKETVKFALKTIRELKEEINNKSLII